MDTDARPDPNDLPRGVTQPVLIPEPDAIGKRVPLDPAVLAHPHERPRTAAGSGDADSLAHPSLTPAELDAFLDAVQRPRIIGRAAGIDVGPAPDRHPSRAQRLADIRRDLEGQYWD